VLRNEVGLFQAVPRLVAAVLADLKEDDVCSSGDFVRTEHKDR
jgi:hypothetical protein